MTESEIVNAAEREIRIYEDECNRLRKENARLKELLKPLLSIPVVSTENVTVIKMDDDDNPWFGHDYGDVVDGGYTEKFYKTILDAHNAVLNAQLYVLEAWGDKNYFWKDKNLTNE